MGADRRGNADESSRSDQALQRGTRPVAVYELFSSSGELLYVGATVALKPRLAAHAREKPWWPEVAPDRTRVSEFMSVAEASAAEERLIREGKPQHNRAGVSRAYSGYRGPARPKPPLSTRAQIVNAAERLRRCRSGGESRIAVLMRRSAIREAWRLGLSWESIAHLLGVDVDEAI